MWIAQRRLVSTFSMNNWTLQTSSRSASPALPTSPNGRKETASICPYCLLLCSLESGMMLTACMGSLPNKLPPKTKLSCNALFFNNYAKTNQTILKSKKNKTNKILSFPKELSKALTKKIYKNKKNKKNSNYKEKPSQLTMINLTN